MNDNLSPEHRHKAMKAVRSKGTSLERRLFAMLAGMRLSGWRRHVSELPGCPDVAFVNQKLVIFADGCFWHGCPHCNRPLPKTNAEYWAKKIKHNIQRDSQNTETLRNNGWHIVRIWEHELRTNEGRRLVRDRIRDALSEANTTDHLSPRLP